MPHARRLLYFLLVGGLVIAAGTGCGNGSGESGSNLPTANATASASAKQGAEARSSADVAAVDAVATAAGRTAREKQEFPRKIIYTGQISLACEDLDRAIDGLERAVRSVGGYIGDANRSGERDSARTATYTVRIASDRFDAFLGSLPRLGEFESSTRTAQDVSEEFYDATARLKNKRVEEARLIDLLKRVAGNLDQILRVEGELSRIRGEIEEIEGRLRFLAHQTDLSTVTVNLREVKNFVPEGPPTLRTRIARTFNGSIDGLAEFATTILLFVVGVAPWALPIGVVGLAVFTIRRRRRKQPIVHEPARE